MRTLQFGQGGPIVGRLSLFRRGASIPPLRVRQDGEQEVRVFTDTFQLGRDAGCEIQVDASLASRRHAEVRFEEGAWWLHDLGSTNGTYVEGRRIDALRLGRSTQVRCGREGPAIHFEVDADAYHDEPASTPRRATDAGELQVPDEPSVRREPEVSATPVQEEAPKLRSTQEFARYYFGKRDTGQEAGQHTRMIRRAYQSAHRKQRRGYRFLAVLAVLVTLAALGIAWWQTQRAAGVGDLQYALRAQEAEIARIRTVLEERSDASLEEQLLEMQERRATLQARYDGYIQEYGIRRELTEEERVIFKVARIFNESQEQMPPEFVRAVREQIGVWQTSGRQTFITAVERAEERGYTGEIVRTMQEHGLPPEFFYLALQESTFRPMIVGPWTRYGHAKGMWQFIPETAKIYGLELGPRVDEGVYDEQDDRHDVQKSTVAAARYLRDIYGYLAHASGLLAMASYNWGEHRIVGKLDELMVGIPDTPQARSYWRFYTVYSDRMPEQTKEYVIKIFSAAVIGEDPRLFGFAFDNPLEKYIDASAAMELADGNPFE